MYLGESWAVQNNGHGADTTERLPSVFTTFYYSFRRGEDEIMYIIVESPARSDRCLLKLVSNGPSVTDGGFADDYGTEYRLIQREVFTFCCSFLFPTVLAKSFPEYPSKLNGTKTSSKST